MKEYLKSLWKFIRLIHNFRIAILASSWAKQVQKLANQFTAIQHDIRNGEYGEPSDAMRKIANDLQRTNGATHGLWEQMKKELNIE